MSRRVVITGMGAVTPLGLNVDEFWNGLKEGRHGFGPITQFDASEYKCKVVGEVKGFVAKDYIDPKAARRMARFSQFAVAAAKEAVADAKLDMTAEDPYMVGTCVGSGVGSLQELESAYEKIMTKGPNRVSPFTVPMMISNIAAGNIAIQLGCKGKSIDVVTACASGTNSIGEAFRTIQYGDADVMIAGGTEAAVSPIGISTFDALTALSSSDNPDRCSIPFDKERDGFVMGEGAGVIVLEELEHAKKRGAKIYAEIIGYGATSDAYHITSPEPTGDGAARAIKRAIEDANIKPEDIDYINAHGTSTHLNDVCETMAIKKALGEDVSKKVMVSSTKGNTGHLLGAAGAIEAIFSIKAIENKIVPPTINYKEKDEECDLDIVPNEIRKKDLKIVMSNSLGFGGHNGSVIFKEYEE